MKHNITQAFLRKHIKQENPYPRREPFRQGLLQAQAYYNSALRLLAEGETLDAACQFKQCAESVLKAIIAGAGVEPPATQNLYTLQQCAGEIYEPYSRVYPTDKHTRKLLLDKLIHQPEALKESEITYIKNRTRVALHTAKSKYLHSEPPTYGLNSKGTELLKNLSPPQVAACQEAVNSYLQVWTLHLDHKPSKDDLKYMNIIKEFGFCLNERGTRRVYAFNHSILHRKSPHFSKTQIINHLRMALKQDDNALPHIQLLVILETLLSEVEKVHMKRFK